eukprot:4900998-Prymnesium_polylepis.1
MHSQREARDGATRRAATFISVYAHRWPHASTMARVEGRKPFTARRTRKYPSSTRRTCNRCRRWRWCRASPSRSRSAAWRRLQARGTRTPLVRARGHHVGIRAEVGEKESAAFGLKGKRSVRADGRKWS